MEAPSGCPCGSPGVQGQGYADGMLNHADMAARPDMDLGVLQVSPSRRIVSGPAGQASLEPRIMQVLVMLLDAKGAVVTRNQIFDQCWGGMMVGDDSINRAIGRLRKVEAEVAPGAFEIETIPRTGYRLTGDIFNGGASEGDGQNESHRAGGIDRRLVIGGGLAVAAAAAGAAWLGRERSDPRVAALMADGERTLLEAWPDAQVQGVESFRKAVAIDPDNARGWGLLAVALRNVVEEAPPDQTSGALRECQSAAQRALALDPREGNALAALATLHPYFGEWAAAEDRLHRVLEVAPDNPTAMSHLITLYQSVGRGRDSWVLNERMVELEPLSPVHQFRRALKFWIFGRVPEADLTIDRALQLWPRHPAVWNARLMLFAFTGRPDAALALIEDDASRPRFIRPAFERTWSISLAAIRTRDPVDVAAAREANVKVAKGPSAVSALMILSHLGELDAAFAIANGFLLRKGPTVTPLWADPAQTRINDQQWRRTMNLFTPATAPMRADPRFRQLCDGIGLTAYWKQRGQGPDPVFRVA